MPQQIVTSREAIFFATALDVAPKPVLGLVSYFVLFSIAFLREVQVTDPALIWKRVRFVMFAVAG
jgi:hypothetical protein